MNKPLYIIGVILMLGFAVLGAMELMNTSTPYVMKVSEVVAQGERPVQFMGKVVPKSAKLENDGAQLAFTMKDEVGDKLNVRYKGVKPSNFDTATSVVVRGSFRKDVFEADTLLLKCPSKYEGKK